MTLLTPKTSIHIFCSNVPCLLYLIMLNGIRFDISPADHNIPTERSGTHQTCRHPGVPATGEGLIPQILAHGESIHFAPCASREKKVHFSVFPVQNFPIYTLWHVFVCA